MAIAKKTTEELIELQKKHGNEFMFNFVKYEMEKELDKINCEYTYLEIWEEGIILFNELYNSTVENKAHLISNKFDIYISRYNGGRQQAKEITKLVFRSAAFMAYYEYQINNDKEDIVNKLRFKNPHAGKQYSYFDDEKVKMNEEKEPPYVFLYDCIAPNDNVKYVGFNMEFHYSFDKYLQKAYAGEECSWDTNSCYINNVEAIQNNSNIDTISMESVSETEHIIGTSPIENEKKKGRGRKKSYFFHKPNKKSEVDEEKSKSEAKLFNEFIQPGTCIDSSKKNQFLTTIIAFYKYWTENCEGEANITSFLDFLHVYCNLEYSANPDTIRKVIKPNINANVENTKQEIIDKREELSKMV